MRFLIVGAAGQDGRWASKILQSLGHEVILTIRPSAETPKSINGELYKVNLVDPSEAFQFLEKVKPDRILHLAAVHGSSTDMVNNNDSFKRLMHDCHVKILQNLIIWQQRRRECKISVSLSSHIFSGYVVDKIITEDTEPFPSDYYGESKLEAWKLINESRLNFGSRVDSMILFNHTSNYSKPNFLFPQIARQIQEIKKGELFSLQIDNFDARLSICHAYDVAQSIVICSLDNSAGDFVIGNEEITSIRKLLTDYSESVDSDLEFSDMIARNSNHELEPRVLIPNCEKAKKHLLWQPTISPVEILAQMVSDYNPSNRAC